MAAADRGPDRFVHIRQEDIRRDPMGVVERIYGHFGLPMSADAEVRFRAWAAANPPDARSTHRYRPVEADAVDPLFADYIARFDLTRSAPAGARSEARRVGNECVRTYRSRWSPFH